MARAPIPLHRNESYWLLDTPGLHALAAPDVRSLSTYPDYGGLSERIALLHGVSEDSITLAPGSDAAIAAIAELCAHHGWRALLPLPSFYGYERILSRYQVPTTPVYHERDADGFVFPEAGTLAAIEEGGVDIVFLCNPNNPLGDLIPEETLTRIIGRARSRGIRVVIDEAYADFDNPSRIGEIDETVSVIRTFSKGYGLAGARVGYCLSDPGFADELAASLLPWPIAHASTVAALRALELEETIAQRRMLLIAERERFARGLAGIPGFRTYPSRGNFIFVDVPDPQRIAAALAAELILVAQGSSLSFDPHARTLLSSGLRFSTPAPDDHERVIATLRACIV